MGKHSFSGGKVWGFVDDEWSQEHTDDTGIEKGAMDSRNDIFSQCQL